MRERVLLVGRDLEAERRVASAEPIRFDPLAVGDSVDLGNGPQEVRHVVSLHSGSLAYELARPSGRTPLQTVSHRAIERLAQETYDRKAGKGGHYGGAIAAMALATGMIARRSA